MRIGYTASAQTHFILNRTCICVTEGFRIRYAVDNPTKLTPAYHFGDGRMPNEVPLRMVFQSSKTLKSWLEFSDSGDPARIGMDCGLFPAMLLFLIVAFGLGLKEELPFLPLLVQDDLEISLGPIYATYGQVFGPKEKKGELTKSELAKLKNHKPTEWLFTSEKGKASDTLLNETSDMLAEILAVLINDPHLNALWPSPEDARKFKELMSGIVLAGSGVERQNPDAPEGTIV